MNFLGQVVAYLAFIAIIAWASCNSSSEAGVWGKFGEKYLKNNYTLLYLAIVAMSVGVLLILSEGIFSTSPLVIVDYEPVVIP